MRADCRERHASTIAMNNKGEDMGNDREPGASGRQFGAEAHREMECRVDSLRALVFELLMANQQLRDALLNATNGGQGGEEGRPQAAAGRRHS